MNAVVMIEIPTLLDDGEHMGENGGVLRQIAGMRSVRHHGEKMRENFQEKRLVKRLRRRRLRLVKILQQTAREKARL